MPDKFTEELEFWNTHFNKIPNTRIFYWSYDKAPEPRPNGRYLLCAWDGKNEYIRTYHSQLRRWFDVLVIKWRSRDFMRKDK